mgnify:CR=1 FL=1
MAVSRHAIVAGAGIGGLTAAVALRHRGWDVTILERAQALMQQHFANGKDAASLT